MASSSPQIRPSMAIVWMAVCVLAAALFFAVKSQGAPVASNAGASAAVRHGDEIFHQRCIICHNQQPGNNLPFGPPNLYTVFRGKAITGQQAETIITQGKGGMPSFRSVLTKSDIRSVIAYLKTR